MGVKDELAVAALTRALVRTGMYVDAGIDTSAGLDKPQVYAAAILSDPDLAADGLHFVMVETLERVEEAARAEAPAAPEPDWERLYTEEAERYARLSNAVAATPAAPEALREAVEYDRGARYLIATERIGPDEYGASMIVARDVDPDFAGRVIAALAAAPASAATPAAPEAQLRAADIRRIADETLVDGSLPFKPGADYDSVAWGLGVGVGAFRDRLLAALAAVPEQRETER